MLGNVTIFGRNWLLKKKLQAKNKLGVKKIPPVLIGLKYTSQDFNTLLITLGDCVIESVFGGYECVMSLPYLNNKG